MDVNKKMGFFTMAVTEVKAFQGIRRGQKNTFKEGQCDPPVM
jgi:hypothetical protein